jgi:hypothetical protein
MVGAGGLFMLSLQGGRRQMRLLRRSFFHRSRPHRDASRPTVIAHPVHGGVVDHGFVIDIVNIDDAHIVD